MATSVLPPHLFWRIVYLFISAISAPRYLQIFFNCYDFEGKLWKLALPVLPQIAPTRKWHGNTSRFGVGKTLGWHPYAKRVMFPFILDLSRFSENYLDFFKCTPEVRRYSAVSETQKKVNFFIFTFEST